VPSPAVFARRQIPPVRAPAALLIESLHCYAMLSSQDQNDSVGVEILHDHIG
jgi:hypothetical protein